MKEVTRNLYINFNMRDMDWLGYKIYRKNDLDFHHIKKREDGGKFTYSNGAVLNHMDHGYLHIIEYKDLDMYVYLNMILKQINEQGYMPTKQQLIAINFVLEQFEREHCSDYNCKGQPLIKEEYTRRLIRK